jgi:hypothetical protein
MLASVAPAMSESGLPVRDCNKRKERNKVGGRLRCQAIGFGYNQGRGLLESAGPLFSNIGDEQMETQDEGGCSSLVMTLVAIPLVIAFLVVFAVVALLLLPALLTG